MTVPGLQELRMPLFPQDVPLISLANIFQNARLWEDALTVARMAVEIAPHFVVNHFTLANVYIAMVSRRSRAKNVPHQVWFSAAVQCITTPL